MMDSRSSPHLSRLTTRSASPDSLHGCCCSFHINFVRSLYGEGQWAFNESGKSVCGWRIRKLGKAAGHPFSLLGQICRLLPHPRIDHCEKPPNQENGWLA